MPTEAWTLARLFAAHCVRDAQGSTEGCAFWGRGDVHGCHHNRGIHTHPIPEVLALNDGWLKNRLIYGREGHCNYVLKVVLPTHPSSVASGPNHCGDRGNWIFLAKSNCLQKTICLDLAYRNWYDWCVASLPVAGSRGAGYMIHLIMLLTRVISVISS